MLWLIVFAVVIVYFIVDVLYRYIAGLYLMEESSM